MTTFLAQHAAHLIMFGGPLLVLGAMMLRLHLTDPARVARRPPRSRLILVLAATWVAAAGVHLSVTPEHFREATLLGVFFLLLAGVQVTYAVALLRRPEQKLLLAGMVTNAAVIALWLWSRTISVPFGIGGREAVGATDLACTVIEAVSLALSVILLRKTPAACRPDTTSKHAVRRTAGRGVEPAGRTS